MALAKNFAMNKATMSPSSLKQAKNDELLDEFVVVDLEGTKLQQLTIAHQNKLQQLDASHKTKLQQLDASHKAVVQQLIADQNAKVHDIEEKYEKTIASMEMKHTVQLDDLAASFDRQSAQHEVELASLGKKMEEAEKASKEKIERYKKALAVEIARGG